MLTKNAARHWSVRIALLVVLVLAGCIAGAVAYLGTQSGRDTVARFVERAASDDQTTVRIARVTGNLASTFQVGEISLADASGNVTIVEEATLSWRPLSLIGGTLDIKALKIGRVSVSGFGGDQPVADGSPSTDLPAVAIRVAALTIREIVLDERVLGVAQRLSLTGSASIDGSRPKFAVKARLDRIDGTPGHADIDIAYTARPAQFTAKLDIEEQPGGLIARLLGLPGTVPLSVKLDGAGPPDGWRGRLVAGAAPVATLSSTLAVSVGDSGVSLSLTGDTSVANLLPEAARPLAAPQIRFEAALDYGTAGTLTVRKFTAMTAALSADLAGRYDPKGGAISAILSVAGAEGLEIPGLSPGLKIDAARIDAKLDGTISEPVLSARIAVKRLASPAANAAGVVAQFDATAGPDRPIALSGDVRVESVDAGDAIPAGLLSRTLDVHLDGLVGTDGTVPRLELKIASGALSADINAAMLQPEIIEGRYSLRHNDVGALAASSGLAVRGAADAKGDFRADLSRGNAHLGIAGALGDISSEMPWLALLLAPRTSFAGDVTWQADDTLRIAGLDVASDAGRVRGEATIRPAAGTMTANYAVSLADLAKLSGLAGVPLGGRLQVTGSAAGPLQTPEVTAQIAASGLKVSNIAIGNVGAGIAARPEATGFRAAIRLGGDVEGRALDGDIDLLIDGSRVRLPRYRLALGRNRLAGGLTIDTARSRLTGDATATLSHMEDLPSFSAPPMFTSGTGTVRIELRSEPVQILQLDAKADRLALGDRDAGSISIGTMAAKLSIRDPFAAPSVDGKLQLSDLRAQGATLRQADLTAKGNRASLDWTVSADGKWQIPVSLAAAGSLSLAGDGTSLMVKRLDGKLAEYTVGLRDPASVRWSPRGVKAGPVDLAISDGALRLTANSGGNTLDVAGEIEKLPLTLATLIEPRLDLAGTLSGKIRLAGNPSLPVIDIALSATGVRPSDLPGEEFDGLSIDASLRQTRDDVRMTLKMRGPDDIRADADLRTAPIVSLDPPRLLAGADQPVSGKIDASARLAIIDRILSLGDDRLAGNFSAKARISGALAQPDVHGEASLSSGAYEGAATGVVIREAAARIDFTGSGARLVSLTAIDGNGGRLSGAGAFSFKENAATDDRLTVKLDHFTALRRPEAEIVTTGALTVKGPLASPAIEGKLTVEKGEIRIPDRLPDTVVDLQVVEINLPDGVAAPSRSTEPSASRALPLALDLAIDFPGRTFVRGRGLDSEWKGALTIKGTSAEPKIAGKLGVVRGTFAFAGKTFVLKNGDVVLSGSEPIEPEIDATAEARLKTLLARIRIEGKVSRPAISVTSEPPLPQEEVLAHILFGRTTGQLSAIQAAQLAQTAATLSGKVGGVSVVDRVRQALGVDVLNVESSEGAGTGASLKAGKYITEDVFLSVTQGTEPGSQKVGVEVEVLPNLSVESDISGTASSNVGVNWKFDY